MQRMRLLVVTLLAALLVPGAFPLTAQAGTKTSSASWQLSRSQLRTLLHNAPSVASCQKLADYFHGREQEYRNQAEEMNLILMQRQIAAANAGGRYAQSVDSGQRLREYYLQMAHEMDTRAAFWAHREQQLQ